MANEQVIEQEVSYPGKACTIKAYVAEPPDGGPKPGVDPAEITGLTADPSNEILRNQPLRHLI